jgi:hypothetical protein
MGIILLGVILGSAGFFSGCTEQAGVEVDGDDAKNLQSSVFISRIEVMHPYEGEEFFVDTVASVLVYVGNLGQEVATEDFYFSINGLVKQMKSVTFRPGENQVISFSTACTDGLGNRSYLSEIGEYRLGVNGFETTVDVVELPVLLRVELIEWYETEFEDKLVYVPNIVVYVVNTGDAMLPLDYWELDVNGELVTNIARIQESTIDELAPFAEGRVVLVPSGVFSMDENGLDITISELRLRDIPTDEYRGGILGLVTL